MAQQRLYIVQGTGTDTVGLVGKITGQVAKAGGNIVDLRQDVLYGLFTVIMVVDLSATDLHIEELKKAVKDIAEDTGLRMTVEKYSPIPRSPEKKDLLMILVGKDKAGIIAAVSESLGKYHINIEFARTISREGIFLMELLVDISKCAVPLKNLIQVIEENMAALDIRTIFQTDDVFNKKKRVILFDIRSGLLSREAVSEIMRQTRSTREDLALVFSAGSVGESVQNVLACLGGFPVDVLERVVAATKATSGTVELLQTLKFMGYKVCLVSNAFSPVTDYLKKQLALDYSFGITMPVDDDSRTIIGEPLDGAVERWDADRAISLLMSRESVLRQDITVISDAEYPVTPGIHIEPGMDVLLDYFNRHALTKENIAGILGCFGMPHKV